MPATIETRVIAEIARIIGKKFYSACGWEDPWAFTSKRGEVDRPANGLWYLYDDGMRAFEDAGEALTRLRVLERFPDKLTCYTALVSPEEIHAFVLASKPTPPLADILRYTLELLGDFAYPHFPVPSTPEELVESRPVDPPMETLATLLCEAGWMERDALGVLWKPKIVRVLKDAQLWNSNQ
jgi:hypothetical protein